jgi:hypothetical protein
LRLGPATHGRAPERADENLQRAGHQSIVGEYPAPHQTISPPIGRRIVPIGCGNVTLAGIQGLCETVLDREPKEPRWLSWMVFAGTAAGIWTLVPLSLSLREWVDEYFGRELFLYFTLATVLGTLVAAISQLNKRKLPRAAYIWLAVVSSLFLLRVFALRNSPEETVHYISYGALSLLAYRALAHRVHDHTIYVMSAIMTLMIGIVDEFLQWLTPSRIWHLRDLQINFEAACMVQIGLAMGLRPKLIANSASAAHIARVCRLSAVALLMIAPSFANTPSRIIWTANQIPWLSYLIDKESGMIEYGHQYRDPDIGFFRSRFSPEELSKRNETSGADAAEILSRYDSRESFKDFRARYTIFSDPYTHEIGIHVFTRNMRLLTLATEDKGEEWKGKIYDWTLREHRILENYFPNALNLSSHRWPTETLRKVEANAFNEKKYRSNVSGDLITRFREGQVLSMFGFAIAGFLFAGYFLIRKTRRDTAPNLDGRLKK